MAACLENVCVFKNVCNISPGRFALDRDDACLRTAVHCMFCAQLLNHEDSLCCVVIGLLYSSLLTVMF